MQSDEEDDLTGFENEWWIDTYAGLSYAGTMGRCLCFGRFRQGQP